MDRDQKTRTRIIIVTIISSLELDDIQRIIANDTKYLNLRQTMVDHELKSFPQLSADKVKEFIDSCIGNVVKAYKDLREKKPYDIDLAKLQLWRQVWMREKEKSRRADDIDSRFLLSKKMMIAQASQASHAEASSSEQPQAREDALVHLYNRDPQVGHWRMVFPTLQWSASKVHPMTKEYGQLYVNRGLDPARAWKLSLEGMCTYESSNH